MIADIEDRIRLLKKGVATDTTTDEDFNNFKNFIDNYNVNNLNGIDKKNFLRVVNTIENITERHMPSMSFIGPGTNVFKRLLGKKDMDGFLPRKLIDQYAVLHDLYYSFKDPRAFIKADKILLEQARGLTEHYSLGFRGAEDFPALQALLVYGAMKLKIKFFNPIAPRFQKTFGTDRFPKIISLIGDPQFEGTFTDDDEREINNVYDNYKKFIDRSGLKITVTGREGIFRETPQSKKSFSNLRTSLSNVAKRVLSSDDLETIQTGLEKEDENFISTNNITDSIMPRKIKGVSHRAIVDALKEHAKNKKHMTHKEVVATNIMLEQLKNKKASALHSLTHADLDYLEDERNRYADANNITDTANTKNLTMGKRISRLVENKLNSDESKKHFSDLDGFGSHLLNNAEGLVNEAGDFVKKFVPSVFHHLKRALSKRPREFEGADSINLGGFGRDARDKKLDKKKEMSKDEGEMMDNFKSGKGKGKRAIKGTGPISTRPPTSATREPTSATRTPTIIDPKTQAPTTQEPTTQEPTTQEPTTQEPTVQKKSGKIGELKTDEGISAAFTPAPILEQDIDMSGAVSSDILDVDTFNVIGAEMTQPTSEENLKEIEFTDEEKKESLIQQVLFDFVPPSLYRGAGNTFQRDIDIRNNIWFAGPLINTAIPQRRIPISNGDPSITLPMKNIYENNLRGWRDTEPQIRYGLQPALRGGGVRSVNTNVWTRNNLFQGTRS